MTQHIQPYLTTTKVIQDHGGDVAFWLGWIHGDVAAEVKAWIRQRGYSEWKLARDLLSIEAASDEDHRAAVRKLESACTTWQLFLEQNPQPQGERARRELQQALTVRQVLARRQTEPERGPGLPSEEEERHETQTDLARADRSPDDMTARSEFTPLILEDGRDKGHSSGVPSEIPDQPGSPTSADDRVRRLQDAVSQALDELLAEVGLQIPHSDRPAELIEMEMLTLIVGFEAIRSFRGLSAWLEQMRPRCFGWPLTALDRVLTTLVPRLVATHQGVYAFAPSVRLFMRDRLHQFLLQQPWAKDVQDLEQRLGKLTRERMAELVRIPLQVVQHEGLEETTGIMARDVLEQLTHSP